jgi:hypothetical protein
MATAEQYAQWIVSNQDKKGTPEFETVSKAYQEAKQTNTTSVGTTPEKKEIKGTVTMGPVEQLFGKGTTKQTTPMERFERIGTAGLTGMAVGGGVGAIGGPATMAAGAITGGIAGVLGETGEQLISATGGSRGQQILGGLMTGGLAEAVPSIGKQIARSVIPYAKQFENLLKSAEPEAVTLKRQELTELAKQKLAKYGYGSVEDVGQAIQSQVDARVQRAQDLAARKEKAQTAETNALRQQQEKAEQELTSTIEKGSGKTESPYNFGTNIRSDIEGIRNPQIATMKKEYDDSYKAAMLNAEQSQTQGSYWGQQSEALDIKRKWKKEAKDSSGPIGTTIKNIINDIWRPAQTLPDGSQIPASNLSAKGIDQIVRQLGEVASGKEVEGYKGISTNVAKELRADIVKGIEKDGVRQGGFYNWSGLGPAKSKYATALENLSDFESKRGESVLGKQDMGLYSVDAEKLPKQLFGSESGVKEFKAMLPDPAKQTQYAQQYVHNELAGKDLKATRKWADQHEFLTREFPEVKNVVEEHLNKLSTLENKSLTLKERVSQSGEKEWSKKVDIAAQNYVEQLGLEEKGGFKKDPGAIVENILNGDYTQQQLRAISKYANDSPIIREKFPQAVSTWLSGKSPSNIMNEFDRILPALKGSGLVTDSQLTQLRKGVQEVVDANRKVLTEPAKLNIQKLIFESFGKSTARTAVSGQIDIGGKE